MRLVSWLVFLVTLSVVAWKCASGSEVVASQWVVFDALNSTTMYGNPAYGGAFGAPYIPGKLVKQIYFGLRHAVALTEDGALFGWGKDDELDDVALGGIRSMVPVPIFNSSIVAAAASANATFVVTSTGQVWFVGALYFPAYSTEWVQLTASGNPWFVGIKCGYGHCIAQTLSGKLFGVGWNDVGQISSFAPSVVTSLLELPGLDDIPNIFSVLYCTGGKHTSVLISRTLWQLGDCHAISGDCPVIPSLVPRYVNLSFPDIVTQVECGSYHTVVKSSTKVYATGANDVGQSFPLAPGPYSLLREVPDLNFGTNKIIVVGNTTVGRNIFGFLTGFGVNNSAMIPPGVIGGDTYERPPWLRMLTVDEGSGSSFKYTFGVRFRESGTCEDPRPLSGAVCLPTADPTKGRWSMQRPLQMAANRLFSLLVLNRIMTVYGDFILNSNASINFDWPSDPDSPSLEVEGCAQIDGQLSISISPDNIQDIRKNHKGKRTIQLIKSQCPFYSGSSKRDIRISLQETDTMAPGDEPYATEPDPSLEPTDNAKAGDSSSNTILLEPTTAPSASSSSSCSKTSVSTEEQSNSDGTTTLVAVITVNSSSCDTWWIVLASVLGGLGVIVAVAAVVVMSVPKIRAVVLPFYGSRS